MSLTHKENKKEALKDEFFKKLRITKRDKSQTEFDRKRIYVALAAAFKDHLKMKKNEIKYPAEKFSSDLTDEEKRKHYYQIKAKYRGSHPLAE